jgi:hypothetical protein
MSEETQPSLPGVEAGPVDPIGRAAYAAFRSLQYLVDKALESMNANAAADRPLLDGDALPETLDALARMNGLQRLCHEQLGLPVDLARLNDDYASLQTVRAVRVALEARP